MNLDALTEAVADRLFIEIEASGRHVHLTREQVQQLFAHPLTPVRELSQPGQFLARERVTVRGPGGEFANVAVLGPERPAGQVEISLTDGKVLGLRPPIRLSGDIAGTPGAELTGPAGKVQLTQGVICAARHIHMTPERARALGISDGQRVCLQVDSCRPVLFRDVAVRVSPDFRDRVHLDYDEANACALEPGELGRILPCGHC